MRWGAYNWVYLSASLQGKHVGALEMGNGIWRVFYRNVFLGYFDENELRTKDKSVRILPIQTTGYRTSVWNTIIQYAIFTLEYGVSAQTPVGNARKIKSTLNNSYNSIIFVKCINKKISDWTLKLTN